MQACARATSEPLFIPTDIRGEKALLRAARQRCADIRHAQPPPHLQPLLLVELRRRPSALQRNPSPSVPSLSARVTGAFRSEMSEHTSGLAAELRHAPVATAVHLFRDALRICGRVAPAQDLLCARVSAIIRELFTTDPPERYRAAAVSVLRAEPLDTELARGVFLWDGSLAREWWESRASWRAPELLALAAHAAWARASDTPLRGYRPGATTRERLLLQNALGAWPRERCGVIVKK